MLCDHWTPEDHASMHTCESMHHLAEIAIRMCTRLKHESHDGIVTLLSGPMTSGGLGSFEANMHVFEHAIMVARERGFTVFNQLPFQHGLIRLLELHHSPLMYQKGDKTYPQRILDEFYWPLFEARVIGRLSLFPTWISSNGSTQELNKGIEVDVPLIEEYDPDWYEEVIVRSMKFLQQLKKGVIKGGT